jgi:hypothetical protein
MEADRAHWEPVIAKLKQRSWDAKVAYGFPEWAIAGSIREEGWIW